MNKKNSFFNGVQLKYLKYTCSVPLHSAKVHIYTIDKRERITWKKGISGYGFV